jgi:hypothetical protein
LRNLNVTVWDVAHGDAKFVRQLRNGIASPLHSCITGMTQPRTNISDAMRVTRVSHAASDLAQINSMAPLSNVVDVLQNACC